MRVDIKPLNPILVVDDDAGIRELITETLADEGYAVVAAPNGSAAIQLLEGCQPSLILLDLLMPLMDGHEFLRWYRQRPGPHVPVVVFSASGLSRFGHTRQHIDAEAFLAKPFDLEELLRLIMRFAPAPLAAG